MTLSISKLDLIVLLLIKNLFTRIPLIYQEKFFETNSRTSLSIDRYLLQGHIILKIQRQRYLEKKLDI